VPGKVVNNVGKKRLWPGEKVFSSGPSHSFFSFSFLFLSPFLFQCLPVLRKFAADQERVVKESCMVALDMHEYETSGQFQYADGLERV
jgi:hypothetical protein